MPEFLIWAVSPLDDIYLRDCNPVYSVYFGYSEITIYEA